MQLFCVNTRVPVMAGDAVRDDHGNEWIVVGMTEPRRGRPSGVVYLAIPGMGGGFECIEPVHIGCVWRTQAEVPPAATA